MWISVDIDNDITTGHIFMTVEGNNKIKLLDAWVHEDYRRMGIYQKFMGGKMETYLKTTKDIPYMPGVKIHLYHFF
jgi:hypothetical protein